MGGVGGGGGAALGFLELYPLPISLDANIRAPPPKLSEETSEGHREAGALQLHDINRRPGIAPAQSALAFQGAFTLATDSKWMISRGTLGAGAPGEERPFVSL